MTIKERKAHLITLIEKERDSSVLDLVEKMLDRKKSGLDLKKPIVQRALRAEQDILAGRTQTWEEVDAEVGAFIDQLYARKKDPHERIKSRGARPLK